MEHLLVYQVNLDQQEPDRSLYLAIPESIYERMCQQRVFEVVAQRYKVNFLIYNPITKQITKWIEN
jgi:XisH protein